jgi:O-antigen/teichoic acid export membrane protein
MLGLIATKKEVGLYVVAYSIYSALLVGEGLLARKLFPKLTKAFHDNNEVKKVLIMSIIYKSLYFITAIIITYYLLNNIIFTYLYTAEEFNKSSIILDFMLIGLISHIFANNTNYLLMLENKYLYMSRFSVGLLLNIILGCSFYYLYNLEGYTIAIQSVKLIMITYSIYVSFYYLQRKILGFKHD